MITLLFWLAVAFILCHELDAMTQREWRVLPILRGLPDDTGRRIFVWAHVPLCVGIAAIVQSGAESRAAFFLSVFCIIHVGLHFVFRHHAEYRFHGATSRFLIWGAGLFGALHIAFGLWA